MALHQYIGARYVPKFYENSQGTSAWESGVIYEPLTIVTYNGNSYTSKKPVPAEIGNPSNNPDYWVATGVFNQQLAAIQQEIADIENMTIPGLGNTSLRSISERRFVIIGDSYAEGYTPDGNVTGWADLMVSMLGLDQDQYEISYRGGAGFVANTQGATFIDLLTASSMSDPDSVTDVIVSGGYNDYGTNQNTIKNAIVSFCNLSRSKYPNAKIWVGHCGWTKNSAILYQMGQSVRNYIEGAAEAGAAYLSNIENAMHRYFHCFATDGVHANAVGQKYIAEMTADVILGGSGDMYGAYLTISVDPANEGDVTTFNRVACTLRAGAVTIMCQQAITYEFATPFNYTCRGNTEIDLGTITGNSYFVGSGYDLCNVQTPAFVKANNVYHRVDGVLTFKNGHIYCRLKAVNSAGNAWEELTGVNFIEFGLFAMSFDAKLC